VGARLLREGRAQERLAYVLTRMREDGVLAQETPSRGLPTLPTLVAYERPRPDIGFHFINQVETTATCVRFVTPNLRMTIPPENFPWPLGGKASSHLSRRRDKLLPSCKEGKPPMPGPPPTPTHLRLIRGNPSKRHPSGRAVIRRSRRTQISNT
jgi:hypothetical protein